MSRMDSEPQSSLSSDLLGTVVRPPSIRVSRSFRSTLSGRLTPRSSPSFRRSPSVRTPTARDTRLSAASPSPWKFLSSKRLLPWLIVIVLWAYIGLLLQSRWAHNDGQGSLRSQLQADQETGSRIIFEQQHRVEREKLSHNNTSGSGLTQPRTTTNGAQTLESNLMHSRAQPKGVQDLESNLTHRWIQTTVEQTPDTSEHNRKAGSNHSSWIFPSVGTVNDSVGTLVGPFQDLEKLALGSVLKQKLDSCSRNGAFAGFVKGRNFMLVFHELSMTGSPLAMMELASEILSCGGKVTVVALSHKGGLLQELLARGIRVLKSKAATTFKAAARVDLLVAGSAVCASWIEKYSLQNKQGSKRLVWWIMENRREYFNRSKHMLGLAKALIFLSESQLQQWKAWSQLEGIILPDMTRIVPLCVNQELSLKAGLYERNNTEENNIKRLRDLVRAEMGLKPHDVLLTTLSSINPGKGQLKLLQAVAMVVEESEGSLKGDSHIDAHMERDIRKLRTYSDDDHKSKEGRLRLLIGSVGSKSNKIDYVQKLLGFVSDHPCLAEVMLWTPVTVHVASLYAASDAYVMNSQGLGETFGRVTVEAMAFSLPILGTNAGGTSEIVENNVTGMVHPIGLDGIPVLAQHIRMMLRNATFRENMGTRGRHKVEKNYLKEMMYENLARIFSGCLKEGLSRIP